MSISLINFFDLIDYLNFQMLEYSLNYQDETPMARFPSSSV